MTEELFEASYPRDKFKYVKTQSRTKGTMGQTEIEHYDIVSLETGEKVLSATRTEHTNLRGLNTSVNWDW